MTYPFIQPNIHANQPWLRLTSPHVPLWLGLLCEWDAWIMCRWSLLGIGSDKSWNVSFVVEICKYNTRHWNFWDSHFCNYYICEDKCTLKEKVSRRSQGPFTQSVSGESTAVPFAETSKVPASLTLCVNGPWHWKKIRFILWNPWIWK